MENNHVEMITDEFGIQMDELCIVLVKKFTRKTGKKEGEPYFKPVGYYPNLEALLSALIDKDIQNSKKLEYIVSRIRTLKLIITEFLVSGRSEPFRSTIDGSQIVEDAPQK